MKIAGQTLEELRKRAKNDFDASDAGAHEEYITALDLLKKIEAELDSGCDAEEIVAAIRNRISESS